MDTFDFLDFVEKQDESSIAVLREKASELLAIRDEISALEAELDTFNKRKNQLECFEMPQIMRDLGMSEFKLDTGEKFKIEDFCSGSLNKAPDFQTAKQWIIDNGGRDLIKTSVSVDFGVGSHNEALSFKADLVEKFGYDPEITEGIHPQTYAAFGREKLKEWKALLAKGQNAEEPPFKELGLYAGSRVKVLGGKK
jgi:hypothetical protein